MTIVMTVMDDQTERKVQRSSAKAEVTTTFTIPKTTCTFTACRYPQQKIHSELDKLPVLTMTQPTTSEKLAGFKTCHRKTSKKCNFWTRASYIPNKL